MNSSKIKNITNSQKIPLEIDAWKLIDRNDCEIIQINLNKGEAIDPHPNPVDVIFYVLAGSGTCTIDNKEHMLNAGDCISIEKNLIRGWKNTSDYTLRLLVVKMI